MPLPNRAKAASAIRAAASSKATTVNQLVCKKRHIICSPAAPRRALTTIPV
jgi:hypothetical protein